jgi:hypothetical protein
MSAGKDLFSGQPCRLISNPPINMLDEETIEEHQAGCSYMGSKS